MSEDPVLSTREQVGEYDAIETLKPGEPVFPLQGGDPFAIRCIEVWVEQCRKAALAEDNAERRKAMLRKALSAENVLWAFVAYQRGEEIEGAERIEINEAQDDSRKWRAPLVAGTRYLREAAARLVDASEHLPIGMALALKVRVDAINRIAEEYEPRRASYGREPELPLS